MFGSTLRRPAPRSGSRSARPRSRPASPSTWPTSSMVGAPIGKPANAIDVVADFGADPNGGAADDTAKFQAAVERRPGAGPAGLRPAGHATPSGTTSSSTASRCAAPGPWYTVLGGRHPTQRNQAVGIYGKYVNGAGRAVARTSTVAATSPSSATSRSGWTTTRSTRSAARCPTRSIDNVWMQHTKVGAWMDGPMDNFTIRNSRILDQTADGVNFHIGVTNSTVTNTFVRNTGDDGLAMWAEGVPNVNNSFTHNTIGVTLLANHLVSYGGRDITITDNVVADSLTNGGGIHVANRYPGVNGATGGLRHLDDRPQHPDPHRQLRLQLELRRRRDLVLRAQRAVQQPDDQHHRHRHLDSSYAALHWIEGADHRHQLQQRATSTAPARTRCRCRRPARSPSPTCGPAASRRPTRSTTASAPASRSPRAPATPAGTRDPPVLRSVAGAAVGLHRRPAAARRPPRRRPRRPTTPPDHAADHAAGRRQPGAGPAGDRVQRQRPVHRRQRGGRQRRPPTGRANDAFPQTYTVDLGSSTDVGRLVLKLPSGWEAAYPEHRGLRVHRRLVLLDAGRRRPGTPSTRRATDQPAHRQPPLPAADLRVQHRLAGRAALRAGGLRRRRDHAADRTATTPPPTHAAADREPGGRAAGHARPARPTSTRRRTRWTATRTPTGRAPTTRSRSR